MHEHIGVDQDDVSATRCDALCMSGATLHGLQSPHGVWELTSDAIAKAIPAKLGLQTELDAMIRCLETTWRI